MKSIEKTEILGIDNIHEGNFNYAYIIVRKNKNFFNWLCEAMYNSFENMPDIDREEYIDKNDKFISKKKDIDNYIDWHESYEANDNRAGIFYGKEKIFINIITNLKFCKILMDNLGKYSKFVKFNRGKKQK